MHIDQLWRYPVKSFGGERIDAATIEADGVRGDHVWAVVDSDSGNIVSAKKFRRFGVLLSCAARIVDDTDARDPEALELVLPDGTTVRGCDREVHDLLSQVVGRPVRLEAQPRSYDEAPLHLVSRAAVDALGTGEPADVALRRFRPQIVVATSGPAGFVEDDWLGRKVAMSAAVLEPSKRTARCVMVTLDHQEVPARRDMLRDLMKIHQVPTLPDEKPAPCIGVYATVRAEGTIAEGDAVEIR